MEELPVPLAPSGGLLVATCASLVSAGTERYVVDLARKNLLAKARERPDQVRRVLQKLRQEGANAVVTQVRAKLNEPMPLGYSAAGIVIECGHGVQEYKPGDRVAVAAPHAEVVAIGRNLAARVPEGVTFEQAAYSAVGAIGLEGVRLARVQLGERVLVIGLGLIGQIVVGLLKAQGCKVFGLDVDESKLAMAKTFGADEVGLGSPRDAIMGFSAGYGVDAVIITAATDSNGPIELAADVARVRGRIVLVGVAGLNVPRPPFFAKELEFTVSSSLGPGRMDWTYEEKGIDYPFGHVRWTAQRNMAAVMDCIASGRLPVEKLTTHKLDIADASRAYDIITGGTKEAYYGVVLQYPGAPELRRTKPLRSERSTASGRVGLSVIGGGNFARLVMLPALNRTSGFDFRVLCTARGLNAGLVGEQHGFARATTDTNVVLEDEATRAVMIATRHDLHADLIVKALRAGKHVFVEKPLCIHAEELRKIDHCVRELGTRCPILMVGFNRRFTEVAARIRRFFAGVHPLSVSFRFAPGPIPREAWPQDEDVGGGRIIGEACHAIDTIAMLTDGVPVRVGAESVGATGNETSDDRVFINLGFDTGAIGSVSYQAGGDRAGPAERIEVFGGGRTAILDDWDRLELWHNGKVERHRFGKDKGHLAEVEAFARACRSGRSPIPYDQVHGVAWASLAAVRSLREGRVVRVDEPD